MSATTVSRRTRTSLVDRDLGDDRAPGALVLVAREAEAAADVVGQWLAPAGRAAAAVSTTWAARGSSRWASRNSHRVGAGRVGQLVDEALDREHVEVGAQRAHRRGPQRRLREAVTRDAPRADVVDRHRVAGGAAAAGRAAGRSAAARRPASRQVGAGEQAGRAAVARARGVALAPHVVGPARRSGRRRGAPRRSRSSPTTADPRSARRAGSSAPAPGRPGTARASSTASNAASSAALWP